MKILIIDMYGIKGASGLVILRKCVQCGHTRAIVNLLPYSIQLHLEERITDVDAVLIREENSRSGMHYCRLRCGSYATGTRESVVLFGEGKLIPAEWYKEEMGGYGKICEFTTDFPSKHEVVLERLEWPQVNDDIEEEEQCPLCWRKDILEKPDFKQGNLVIIKTDAPRLYSEYQKDVKEYKKEFMLFNHNIQLTGAFSKVLSRGNYGFIEISTYKDDAEGEPFAKISSPDHPDEDLVLIPGRYEFYHSWPTDDRD